MPGRGQWRAVDAELFAALRSPAGRSALDMAAELGEQDPLSAVTALRSYGVEPSVASAALTQAGLRRRAAAKFGPAADRT